SRRQTGYAIRREILNKAAGMSFSWAKDQPSAQHQERDDDRDFDDGKPKLEFAKSAHRAKVNESEKHHRSERWDPRVYAKPGAQNRSGAGNLGAHDHDEHEPVQPAHRKACPVAECLTCIS